jgi:NADH:ubiquinone oxidoreductase subunit 5 (subunit L)/multisubunit Na+/H+ antiporter MnhA subunit
VISGLALIGVPISIAPSPFDSILEAGREHGFLSTALLLVIALSTGAYLARAYWLTFGGARGPVPRIPARLRLLGWVSLALAVAVILFGFGISPALGEPLGHYLTQVGPLPKYSPETTVIAVLVSLGGAAIGSLASWQSAVWIPSWARRLALGGFGLDAAALLVAVGARNCFRVLSGFDDRFFDPFGNRLAGSALKFFASEDRFDRSEVDAGFDGLANGLSRLSVAGRRVQTGLVEHYLLAAGAWVLLVAVLSLAVVINRGWLGAGR